MGSCSISPSSPAPRRPDRDLVDRIEPLEEEAEEEEAEEEEQGEGGPAQLARGVARARCRRALGLHPMASGFVHWNWRTTTAAPGWWNSPREQRQGHPLAARAGRRGEVRHQKQQSGDLLLWRERCVIVMYKLHMKKRSVQGWTCTAWNDTVCSLRAQVCPAVEGGGPQGL